MLAKIKNTNLGRVLTFAATKPSLEDEEYTLQSRLKAAGKREFVGIYISENGATVEQFSFKKGNWEFAGSTSYAVSSMSEMYDTYSGDAAVILVVNSTVKQFELMTDTTMTREEICTALNGSKRKKLLEGNVENAEAACLLSYGTSTFGYAIPKNIIADIRKKTEKHMSVMHMGVSIAAVVDYVLMQIQALSDVNVCIIECDNHYVIFSIEDKGRDISRNPNFMRLIDDDLSTLIGDVAQNVASRLTEDGITDGKVACFFTSPSFEEISSPLEENCKSYVNCEMEYYDARGGVFLSMLEI